MKVAFVKEKYLLALKEKSYCVPAGRFGQC